MKKVVIGIVAFFVVVMAMLSYVLFTEQGLKTLVGTLEKVSRGNLQVEDVRGRLAGKFSFEQVSFDSSATSFTLHHFELNWDPATLRFGKFHVLSCVVEDVVFDDKTPENTDENEMAPPSLPILDLPLNIILDDLRVRNIQILSAGETMAEIDRIDLQMSDGTALLKFNTVYLQGNDYELSLSGSIGVDKNWPVEIKGNWIYQIEDDSELHGTIDVSDSLRDAQVAIAMEAPETAQLAGRLQIKDGGIYWQAHLQANEFDPAAFSKDVEGLLDIYATANGSWKEDVFSTALAIDRIEGSFLENPVELHGTANYDGENFDIHELIVKSGKLAVTIKGEVGEKLHLSYSLHPLDSSYLVPWLSGIFGGQGTVSGNFKTPVIEATVVGKELTGQGVSAGEISADLKAEIAANLQKSKINASMKLADVNVDGNHIDSGLAGITGSLGRHKLHLEMSQQLFAVVASADGGWLKDQWQGDINKLEFVYGDRETVKLIQPAALRAGTGNIELEKLCLGYESSTLCLDGNLNDNKWQTGINLAKFNPAIFFEEWPGAVDLYAQARGDLSSESLNYAVDIKNVSGEVKGLPLTGAVKIKQRSKVLGVTDLRLLYGDAQLTADGRLSDTYDVDFQIKVPELKKFAAAIEGRINASGTLYGTKTQPVIDLDFNGKDIVFAETTISALQGDVGVDLHNEGRVEAILRGSDISAGGVDISAVSLVANGTSNRHLFMINAETALGTAEMQGHGSYDTKWQGVLENATLALKDHGTWKLENDSEIVIGTEKSSLEQLCLHAADARVCLQGLLVNGEDWSVQASMGSFPLKFLNSDGVIEFPVQGKLQGSINSSGDWASVSTFTANFKSPEIFLQDRWQDDVRYIFSENEVSAVLDGAALHVNLGSRFQENGELRGNFNVNNIQTDIGNISTLPLDGVLDFNVKDISFLSILTDSRFQPKGQLLGKLGISGTLGNPVAKGTVDLENGEVLVADLGILLEDISIQLRSESSKLNYSLKAKSGPGNVVSSGTLILGGDNGFMVSGGITGKEFEIMKTDEYVFRVSPDLQLEYGGSKDTLIGSLRVPYGRINYQGDSGTVSATDDVVIVDAAEPVKKRDSQFYADIDVRLGEDVQVDAYGLKSDLVGGVRLIDEPGRNLTAKGELIVLNGQFSFYSAELDITRGRLLFSGGDVENPGVEFRAQRKIEKNLVGVDVSGTAQDLDFQLFSEPSMEESNILAYIMFGRALYDSSGAESSLVSSAANAIGIRGVNTVTNKLGKYVLVDDIHFEGDANEEDLSIVLGKHLTKDLFIGYGHNLFDEVGEFKVRYQLGNNFSFETSSSVESTSGDIVYTIER